ncbi:hypothetical protein Tco_0591302 [Tanacetum coccineum]
MAEKCLIEAKIDKKELLKETKGAQRVLYPNKGGSLLIVESSVFKRSLFDRFLNDIVDHMKNRDDAQMKGVRTRDMWMRQGRLRRNILISTDGSKVSTDRQIEGTEEQIESTDGQTKGTEDHTEEGSATQATQTPTSTLFGDDEYNKPKTRLPTSKGSPDIKPLPKIDQKDKGKKKIKEEENSENQLLRTRNREQFSIEERAKFLHDIIDAQRKFLAQQRSEAIRNRPSTKNQLRNQMMTYLKHVGNFKHAKLKIKKFEEVQALYEKIKRSDEDFISIGSAEDERLIKRMNGGKGVVL